MLRTDLRRARPGMTLALPVYHPQTPTRILLKAGYELTPSILHKLKSIGIGSMWVRYPSLDFLGKFLPRELIESRNEVLTQITDVFERLQDASTAKLRYDDYTRSISRMIDTLMRHPVAALHLDDLGQGADNLMRHSAGVMYLSVLLGLKLESYLVRQRPRVDPTRAKDVTSLGLGAMLHDVGLTMLPEEVISRFHETADEQDPAFREHTTLGYESLRGRIEPSAATILLHHHQRHDGSGWAGADHPVLRGGSIHVFSRIVAVADQFDRLLDPVNLPAQPPVWALGAMVSEPMCSRFDADVLAALLEVVPPYPPGSLVKLSDGRQAVCVDHNPAHPCRPYVQVLSQPKLERHDVELGETLDLSRMSSRLFIIEHQGRNVGDLNFERPEFARRSLAASW